MGVPVVLPSNTPERISTISSGPRAASLPEHADAFVLNAAVADHDSFFQRRREFPFQDRIHIWSEAFADYSGSGDGKQGRCVVHSIVNDAVHRIDGILYGRRVRGLNFEMRVAGDVYNQGPELHPLQILTADQVIGFLKGYGDSRLQSTESPP